MSTFERELQLLRDNSVEVTAAPAARPASIEDEYEYAAFSPVFELFGRLHQYGITFPGGPVPPEASLRKTARLSPFIAVGLVGATWLHVAIFRGSFTGKILTNDTIENQIRTPDLSQLEKWLANVVYQYEVRSPTTKALVEKSNEPEGRNRVIDLDG